VRVFDKYLFVQLSPLLHSYRKNYFPVFETIYFNNSTQQCQNKPAKTIRKCDYNFEGREEIELTK
jgi:hypothetical protein